MTDKTTLSRTAQALVDDARHAGFKVEVTKDASGTTVAITGGPDGFKGEAFVHFAVKNIAGNCRLGFPIRYVPSGLRFDYATGRDYAGEYTMPRSIREVRSDLGLTI